VSPSAVRNFPVARQIANSRHDGNNVRSGGFSTGGELGKSAEGRTISPCAACANAAKPRAMDESAAHTTRHRPGKRMFDLAVALPCLLVAAPIILAAMLVVRATSPGPAIFAQQRVGRDERPFVCYKLRTMHERTPDLPTHEAPAAAITPVGSFLRRTKIDELPQLWNVLAGQMSIVGPRPCLPGQRELIEHRRRLGVFALRPGITGLAQVRGIDMSDPKRCAETDAEYMDAISIAEDLRLVVRTFV
jgi:O-antigen biosynthesis protein WbqP